MEEAPYHVACPALALAAAVKAGDGRYKDSNADDEEEEEDDEDDDGYDGECGYCSPTPETNGNCIVSAELAREIAVPVLIPQDMGGRALVRPKLRLAATDGESGAPSFSELEVS